MATKTTSPDGWYIAAKAFPYNGKYYQVGDPVDARKWKHPQALVDGGILKAPATTEEIERVKQAAQAVA